MGLEYYKNIMLAIKSSIQEIETELKSRAGYMINYFAKIFVICFMDRETIDLYLRYEALNNTDIQGMGIQELFELRHDMLELLKKLGGLLED
jgi:hypothetical protein